MSEPREKTTVLSNAFGVGDACMYRPLPADANSSAITDLEFVAAIGKVLQDHHWATIWDLQNILGVRHSLIRAKARRTYRRGLTVGCICGCRGEFRLTPAGRDFLGQGGVGERPK